MINEWLKYILAIAYICRSSNSDDQQVTTKKPDRWQHDEPQAPITGINHKLQAGGSTDQWQLQVKVGIAELWGHHPPYVDDYTDQWQLKIKGGMEGLHMTVLQEHQLQGLEGWHRETGYEMYE